MLLSRLSFRLPEYLRSRRVAVFASVVILVLASGMTISLVSSWRAARTYETYAQLAQVQLDAAYLPAAPNNPVRQDLNRALSIALSQQVSAGERLAQAEEGLRVLLLADSQIDAIGDASAKVDTLVAKLQVQSASGFSQGGMSWELLTLAKKRSGIVSDIRGLSYRANFVTRGVFERVIADRGVLTSEHISALNNSLPDLEDQFDRRANLYRELERVGALIDQKNSAGGTWF